MSTKKLTDLHSEPKEVVRLNEKLTGVDDLYASIAFVNEAGFDVSKAA